MASLYRAKAAPPSVVPFPLIARRAYINRQRAYLAGLTPKAAEKYLRAQFETQAQALRRRGVAEDAIRTEVEALAAALDLSPALGTGGAK